MKPFQQRSGCLFYVLIIFLIIYSTCNAQVGSRKFWDGVHYVGHFGVHQILTNGFKVSNPKSAIICFTAGYCQELLDEMSYKGYLDKNGLLFDKYIGFDKNDLLRNTIGIGSSILFNALLKKCLLNRFSKTQDKRKSKIQVRSLPPIKIEQQRYRSIKNQNTEFNIYRI